MATNISSCSDTSDIIDLFEHQHLYLKPVAKVNVSVQLPQLKTPGKSISNWEVMEKLRHMVTPDHFLILKVAKSTLEFIRFEGEVENKNLVKVFSARLDGKTMKLSGFPDVLKIRAAEAKVNFPSRYDWDSYFRDAKNMDEMKPGERPDTIHFKDLPSRWFANKKESDKDKPSEYILTKVFETFGDIRCVDIPMLDPYRREMSASGTIQTFSFGQDVTFEAFVQFKEYIGFVKAMTALRGMKLVYKGDDVKTLTAAIRVDFDKTKHLSDRAIKKRRLERERLEILERQRETRVKKEREEDLRKKEEDRLRKQEEDRERERKREEKLRKREERRKEREERRRQQTIEMKQREEEVQLANRIALEERKILIAQRKLETIRLLSELFNRIKTIRQAEEVAKQEKELEEKQRLKVEMEKKREEEEAKQREEHEKNKKVRLEVQERELREKILKKFREKEERQAQEQREQLRKKIQGKTKLKSAIVMRK